MKFNERKELVEKIANGEYNNYIPAHLKDMILRFIEIKQSFIRKFKTQPRTEDFMKLLNLSKDKVEQLSELVNNFELKELYDETNWNYKVFK